MTEKTDQTEAAHIITGVRLYALAFPKVAFTLIEDGLIDDGRSVGVPRDVSLLRLAIIFNFRWR